MNAASPQVGMFPPPDLLDWAPARARAFLDQIAAAGPLIVGGRSDAAIRRAGRYGDGWLGIWNSPRRFAAAVETASEEAARAGRPRAPGRHAMQVWCGLADSREAARACLAPAMEAFYQLPFERFER
jgi:alkanesulfonate monooxygenase SsuD/methylene tetrahydromethanopterin reductase-like flavin-dependent oxidoreductase (luciferase family)